MAAWSGQSGLLSLGIFFYRASYYSELSVVFFFLFGGGGVLAFLKLMHMPQYALISDISVGALMLLFYGVVVVVVGSYGLCGVAIRVYTCLEGCLWSSRLKPRPELKAP